jgi:Uma2 family endonuclease
MVELALQLREALPAGRCIFSAPVQTTDGVKVADVGWFTMDRLRPIRRATVYPVAPEICVEVISDSNNREEMTGKMKLYFAAGAAEVWLCGEEGEMEFFTSTIPQAVAASLLCPDFPAKLDLD